MFTTSLPPLFDWENNQHLKGNPFGSHPSTLRATHLKRPPTLALDYERSCTPENGCSLAGTGEDPQTPGK